MRKTAAVTVAVTAATTTTVLAVSGLSASSAAPAGHHFTKIHYTAKTVSVETLDRLDTVANVKLTRRHLNRGGTVKGAAEFTCHQKAKTSDSEHCRGALALKQGLLYVNATLPFSTFKLVGDITGGSGRYKHATGTLSAVIGDTKQSSIMTVKYKIKH